MCITCIDGVKSEINKSLLTARIYVPAEYFQKQKIVKNKRRLQPVKSKGLLFGYDFLYYGSSATSSQDRLQGMFNFDYFYENKLFTTTFIGSYSQNNKYIKRLDTKFQIDDIKNIRRIELGDVIYQGSYSMYPVRIGGIKLGTDFSLRPDIITYPLPSFAGKTSLPSSIDIFIQNSKVLSESLKPGPFEIKDIPVVSYSGEMQVVITDALGRQKIVTIPFATDRKLLRKNLSEYSIIFGILRKNYFINSFEYSKPVFSGRYRKGITNSLTTGFESFIQSQDAGNISIFSDILIGKFGLFSPAVGFSYNKKENSTGYFLGMEYKKSFKHINFSMSGKNFSNNFFQIGDIYGKLKSSYKALLGINLGSFGSLSLSYIKRDYIDRENLSVSNISYKKNIVKSASFYLSFNKYKSENIKDNTIRVQINIPLGQEHTGKISYYIKENEKRTSLNISKNNYTGLSYNIDISKVDSYSQINTRIEYPFNWFDLSTQFSYSTGNYNNDLFYRIGVAGSIVRIGEKTLLERRVRDAFALIKIEPPAKNVDIIANNRKVARTDSKGYAIIPYLSPYIENEIQIDPSSLDIKTHIKNNVYRFIPYRKHGYFLEFKAEKINSVRLKIIPPKGVYLPAGARFYVDGKKVGLLGYKGKAFIEKISEGEHIVEIRYGYGKCSFKINITPEMMKKISPKIGVFKCLPDKNMDNIKSAKKAIKKETKSGKRSILKSKESKQQLLTAKKKDKVSNNQNIKLLKVEMDEFESMIELLEFRENIRLEDE